MRANANVLAFVQISGHGVHKEARRLAETSLQFRSDWHKNATRAKRATQLVELTAVKASGMRFVTITSLGLVSSSLRLVAALPTFS